jgi:hypothetical protein
VGRLQILSIFGATIKPVSFSTIILRLTLGPLCRNIDVHLEHAMRMGGLVGVSDLLQYVPMIDGVALSVHLIDVNAGADVPTEAATDTCNGSRALALICHTQHRKLCFKTRLMLPIRTMSAAQPHQSSSRSSSPWRRRRFRSLPHASDVRTPLVLYYRNTARRACPLR